MAFYDIECHECFEMSRNISKCLEKFINVMENFMTYYTLFSNVTLCHEMLRVFRNVWNLLWNLTRYFITVTLCHERLRYFMRFLWNVTRFLFMSFYVIKCHKMSWSVMSFYVMIVGKCYDYFIGKCYDCWKI